MKLNLAAGSQLENNGNTFIYKAVHDLRAPLSSVKGLVYLIQKDSEKDNIQSYFGLLEKSLDRMNQAISDIITHSKNEPGEINLESVDFLEIGEESIKCLQHMPGACSVRLTLSVAEGGFFFSNRKYLMSIFCNIISNAIRYQDKAKDSFLKISVSFNSSGCQTIFEDNGIGIDDDVRTKVFEKYFMVNPDRGGSGLGLYMVKETIESLGGNIHIRSKLGVGTLFSVQIPNLLGKMG